jgi:ATP-dependent helicase IRC3
MCKTGGSVLRPYQQESLEAILENLKAGIRHQLLVLATGTGKTVIAAHLPKTLKTLLPGKMLFVAHREELLTQAINKICIWNPHLKVGLEKADNHAAPDCDVIVACNASIGRKGSDRMSHFWDDISVIVVDEVHHILADSYMRILEDSGVLKPESNKLLIGLTATPKRRNTLRKNKITTLDDEDIISLQSVFQKIVYKYPIRKAIKDGFLVPLKGYRIDTNTNLENVRTVAGDFQVDELSATVNTTERNLSIIKAWKDYAQDRPTVCFTVDIKHAKDLSEVFIHHGVLAQPIWGSDPQRAEKLKWHESGQVKVLCNCALLTEGYDSPSLSCIVLARPTRSSTLMTQQVGRGTRLHPGKTDCIIIDVVDNTKKCSLVTLPSLLGLKPEMNLHGESLTKAVEILEDLQEKYPSVDFTQLTDLKDVKQYVESIDLFAAPYTEEVKEFSQLSWMAAQDGSYVLSIPERKELSDSKSYTRFLHEKLHIAQNELDEYELSITTTQTDKKLGVFTTLKEAFTTADDVIHRCRADRVRLMTRESSWHGAAASEPQKRYLRKLSKKKSLLWCLCENKWQSKGSTCPICKLQTGITSGQASLAINILQTK